MATNAKLFAATGDYKNEIQLPAMFEEEVNKVCMYLHIKAILNNNRQGTAQTKNKSAVSGGGQKPWKQKGTGRARSGQNTSAVWVRGAKAHGPKSHDYFEKVNKKVKKIAFHSALSAKAAEGKVMVFEALSFAAPKTKDLLSVLAKAGLEQRNALFIVSDKDANLYLSSNNIPWCRCARVADVNTYDIVRANNVVISQAALAELEGGR
ncbi:MULTISPECIES: 50S ribosomal protein L4 [unclassified Fibrobacter]|uniref:50S ribosomal protein L4 n=1 Tax=unclassified Fibrobacter TaxID=2634177 RepID=UPI000D6AC812|nr:MULTISPECIES: 50S ribosomal protein L4 [unclassified Fibrobacter]PWJ60940.1 LSU ribosomal protein L4P [Fibrobacter sp. UWR4]PZW65463.1 LSU ribosomal protein L4P [Fibrobacter sp. UWR1]